VYISHSRSPSHFKANSEALTMHICRTFHCLRLEAFHVHFLLKSGDNPIQSSSQQYCYCCLDGAEPPLLLCYFPARIELYCRPWQSYRIIIVLVGLPDAFKVDPKTKRKHRYQYDASKYFKQANNKSCWQVATANLAGCYTVATVAHISPIEICPMQWRVYRKWGPRLKYLLGPCAHVLI